MEKSTPKLDRALAALAAVLPAAAPPRPKGATKVEVAGTDLVLAWAGDGRLGEVRALLRNKPGPDVVAARELSAGARDLLREQNVGWVDETGAAEIALGTVVVSRTGTPREHQRPARWTPAGLGVAEALLCNTRPTVSDVVAVTGLSSGAATNALRFLTDLDLLDATAARGRGSARVLSDPGRLLDAYRDAAQALASPMQLSVGITWRDPIDGLAALGQDWNDHHLRWSATGAVAAQVLAPFLTSVSTAEVYVAATTPAELAAVAEVTGLRPVKGGRLVLRPYPTVTAERQVRHVDGLNVAPWPRVYVDLLGAGVRGEDAAEHLRDTLLNVGGTTA